MNHSKLKKRLGKKFSMEDELKYFLEFLSDNSKGKDRIEVYDQFLQELSNSKKHLINLRKSPKTTFEDDVPNSKNTKSMSEIFTEINQKLLFNLKSKIDSISPENLDPRSELIKETIKQCNDEYSFLLVSNQSLINDTKEYCSRIKQEIYDILYLETDRRIKQLYEKYGKLPEINSQSFSFLDLNLFFENNEQLTQEQENLCNEINKSIKMMTDNQQEIEKQEQINSCLRKDVKSLIKTQEEKLTQKAQYDSNLTLTKELDNIKKQLALYQDDTTLLKLKIKENISKSEKILNELKLNKEFL